MSDYQATYTESHALLIGINDYDHPVFQPLGNAQQDASDFADLLAASPYGFHTYLLLGPEATKQAILDALFDLRRVDDNGRVIVYFAGHGYTIPDRFEHETGYLACTDTIPQRDYTALELEEVMKLRRFSAAKHIAFIFDACFSGQALGMTNLRSAADRFMERRAYQVLSAGAGDQAVSDLRSMTRLLLQELNPASTSDTLRLNAIGLAVQEQMARETKSTQIPQFGHLEGSQGGDLVFYEPPDAQPVDLLPEAVSRGLRDENARVRFYAIDSACNLLDDPDHGANARAALEALVTRDPDFDVRSRAFEALRASTAEVEQEGTEAADVTPEEHSEAPIAETMPADFPAAQVVSDAAAEPAFSQTAAPAISEPGPALSAKSPVAKQLKLPRWMVPVGMVGLLGLIIVGVLLAGSDVLGGGAKLVGEPSTGARKPAEGATQESVDPLAAEKAWMVSGHADKTAEAFLHWAEEIPQEIPETCAKCHSTTGFQDFLGADGSAVGVVDAAAPVGETITCEACHNDQAEALTSVTFPSGVAIDGLGTSASCISCHQGRESTVSVDLALGDLPADTPDETLVFRNIHYFAAGATLFGTEAQGAYEYVGNTYVGQNMHVDDFNQCTQCHNAHSLEVDVAACANCHGTQELQDIRSDPTDWDGDGDVAEGLYYEFETMHDALYAAITAHASEKVGVAIIYDPTVYPFFFADTYGNGEINVEERYAPWTPRLVRATYNYNYGVKDTGAFAHNGKYLLQITYDSLRDIGGSDATAGMTRP